MEKIKQFLESEKRKDILTVLIVILVGLGSFELGRLSKGNDGSGIKIEYSNQKANTVSSIEPIQIRISKTNSAKSFFASNRGSKYYSLGCSGGQTIKQENRIYFATKEEAEKAGYALSASCN
ncbi:hypothetical protein A3B85_02790 [Candidatus Nomurabacteria bacterium RIFCSPHIGHO2_02_FULL_37_13]|uniref:Ada DNA repair metal-binding domain-containing protein n=1 Tax=Candidatus Nomurabacteria bacterium RIFCSPHIGHO2_02_FULL_37_13 TaxID=1801750 RepID=A0A1F6W7B1_9BACT|nr:MAG: hypothetical protein A2640_01270 [Candidatus Nomurabacteria bacterium RIFCSPHIGHO2_01_FULL_36_23]OGI77656.1 MAG: hypothetical protein A3B85_02790 [Candidatus Nomurabacteria bacterium RIFCSPHIGHO2_02_FULL_37_13]OGI88254.1 MAG: hypothetical protein A2906_01725 [Candidatus Nomurabacteria bacterium RIFCSPLOWO2_01_FULL_37_25]